MTRRTAGRRRLRQKAAVVFLGSLSWAFLCGTRADTFSLQRANGAWSDPTLWQKTGGNGTQSYPGEFLDVSGDTATASYSTFNLSVVTTTLDVDITVGQITAAGSASANSAKIWTIAADLGQEIFLDQPGIGNSLVSTIGNNWDLVIEPDITFDDDNVTIANANGANNNITIRGAIFGLAFNATTDLTIVNNNSTAVIQIADVDLPGGIIVNFGTSLGDLPSRVEISGTIGGDVTSLTKNTTSGNGSTVLTLSGNDNAYTGGTFINGGGINATTDSALGTGNVFVSGLNAAFLSLTGGAGVSNDFIENVAWLILGGPNSRVILNFTGTDLIGGLSIGANTFGPGIYGAIGNALVPPGNQFGNFTGPGTLTVIPEPGTLVSIAGGFGLLLGIQRFRRRER